MPAATPAHGLAPAHLFARLAAWAGGVWRGVTKSAAERLASLFFAVLVLGMLAYGHVRPAYNWDLIAYVATGLENRYDDPKALHAETWRQIDAAVSSEGHLYELKSGNPYNRDQAENAGHFVSQLSMYRVKIGYIAAMRALEPLFGLVGAINFISLAGFAAFAALAYAWLSRDGARQALLIAAPLFLVADGFTMSMVATPDIAVGAMSIGALMAIRRANPWLGALILFASVLVRPDNLILIFALLLAAITYGWRLAPYLAAFVLSFAAVIVIGAMGGHPGWWAHFWFSCVQIQHDMTGFHPAFSLTAMATGYMRGVMVGVLYNDWPALLILFGAAWALLAKAGRISGTLDHGLIFALLIGIMGKFASFPLPDDRFYFPFVAGLILILLSNWKPRFDRQSA